MSMCDKAEHGRAFLSILVSFHFLSIPFLVTLRMFPAGGQYEAAAWCYEDCLQAGRCENALNINYSPGKTSNCGSFDPSSSTSARKKAPLFRLTRIFWHRCIRDIRTIPKSSTKASEANIRQHPSNWSSQTSMPNNLCSSQGQTSSPIMSYHC